MNSIFSTKTTWRVHEAAKSGVLIDARDYYRAFYEAALGATRSILLLGWQFDSDVELVRGSDRKAGASEVELMPFLDELCRTRGIDVRILAWDHSVFFALERELLQGVVFEMGTCDKVQFRHDASVPPGGSHHQKVAVIDGRIAFLGSADICQSRWDTSAHRPDDTLRLARGERYKPYHEVQAVVTGAPARSLVDVFVNRWQRATGEALDPLSLCALESSDDLDVPVTLPLPRAPIAFSRTIPDVGSASTTQEVKELFVSAIRNAERLIYCEMQYFTSLAVRDALFERMNDSSRPKLEIVFVVPEKPEKFKEELTVGPPQSELFALLAETAKRTGHALGIYDVATRGNEGEDVFVYIHSKLMVVDDVFLTIGSSNLTNRSMSLDSEINASWFAEPGDGALAHAIRRLRVRLMLEHIGPRANVRSVLRRKSLVAELDAIAESGTTRLRRHDLSPVPAGVLAWAVHELASEYVDPTEEEAMASKLAQRDWL